MSKDIALERKTHYIPVGLGQWKDSDKLEVMKTYLLTGNIALTSRLLKVPEVTIRSWTRTPWWKEQMEELRVQDELVLSSRLKKIAETTLDLVEDRLQNGDFIYDQKTGQMRRKPASLKDIHKVGMDMQERRDKVLSRQMPVASEEAVDAKLKKLAASFAAIVNGRNTEEAVDVEAKIVESEVVHPESVQHEVRSHCGGDSAQEFYEAKEEQDGCGSDYSGNGGIDDSIL